MKKIIGIIMGIGLLAIAPVGGATSLQSTGNIGKNNAYSPTSESNNNVSLQPAGPINAKHADSSLHAANDASNLLGSSSIKKLTNSPYSAQSIRAEADLTNRGTKSNSWLPIAFFVCLGVTILLTSILVVERIKIDK